MFFISKSVTRNLRTRQGWQALTVLVILLTSGLSSSTASSLSKVTADASGDPATLWEASSASKEVGHKENKNGNRMRQDLPASPAELLKPDKFLFYTYNDQGNMITKQMSLDEIQTLIAGGNGGHVAMEMYEPQKSGDASNGEKKVMDVVEKVQNVLKSALDKPSTLAGSLSTIPEYANAEWSSILPVILTNGEMEPGSTSVEPNYVEIAKPNSSTNNQEESVASSTQETPTPTLKSSMTTETTEQFDKKSVPTVSSFVLTSTAAESNFSMTPSYTEIKSPDKYTEKPMIPVAVITTEGQSFSDQSETIENLVYQTSTRSTVEFNDVDHSATNETSNTTIFEEVPVKVWDESERNVTSHESSVERVTEYVPILTMSSGSMVNDSSALATDELVSSTESETTKLVTETVSQETSTVQTSTKIDPTEKITTVKVLAENTITEIVTPIIETNVRTESVAEMLETTTPRVASAFSTSSITPTLGQTEITKIEQLENSQSSNLRYTTQAISSSTSSSVSSDDNFTILSSVSSSDDTLKQTSSTVTENHSETTEAAILTTTTKNFTLNSLQSNLELVRNLTSNVDTENQVENTENVTNKLEPVEISTIESLVVEESTSSSKTATEASKTDAISSVQPVEASDTTESVSTSVYVPETTFVRIDNPTVGTSTLSSTISESTIITKATPVFNTNDLISSIIAELNDHTLNTTTESVIIKKVTNDTLKENITTSPVLATDETNIFTNQADEFIKNVSSLSASQDTMTTTPVVSDELVTVTDSIKSGSTGTTVTEVQNVTMKSQMETSSTPATNHKVDASVQIINNTLNITSKEPSFIRHQDETLNATTTLLPLKQENITDKMIVTSTTESYTTISTLATKHTTIQEQITTLMTKEEIVTEASLKLHDYVLKNRTNVEFEASLKANESRYSDSKEETSTQTSSTPYIKLNVTFANDLPSTNAPNVSDDNTIATKMELPMQLVSSSTTEKLLEHLPIQENTTKEVSTEKIATVTESNRIEQVTVNGSTNIKSNKTNGTSSETAEDKTKIQMASNDSISMPSRVIEETSSLQSLTSSVPMVTENSVDWQLSSKPTYNEQTNGSYSMDTETTDKWMLISHKIVTPTTERATVNPITQKTPQDITEKPQSSTLDAHLPTMPLESKESERIPLDSPQSVNALDVSVTKTENDVVNFSKMCNNLAFEFWLAANKGLSTSRSLVLSPFGMTSLLAMVFLGARGTTSEQMNELLKLDDVATFNPHLVFQNVTDTVGLTRGQGITNAAFVRELFVDRAKVRKTLPFYKEQAQQFYEGLVAEVNFATIGDIVRRRTNLMIRKQTGGRIKDFIKANTVPLRSPLAAVSANVFQTNCNSSFISSDGRDGELYFAVSPAIRQRKLIPVPAIVWRSNILAGYEPSLDATAVALGKVESLVTTVFVLPGQQGHVAPGDSLDRLERRLIASASRDSNWNRLLKVLLPRNSLELQIPKFTHRSVVNATAALRRMGFERLFTEQANLKGINGIGNHLHLSDILQINLFGTCGDEIPTNGRHHMETYPATPIRRSRQREQVSVDSDGMSSHAHREPNLLDYLEMNAPKFEETILMSNKTDKRRKRDVEDAKVMMRSERPRLKLDRPFLYFVRHNPTGLILHMGRFNPRLLP
ncbi:hypothetical protein KPH14_006758 [Odynerus spinipes]|uniref:Serpin domain-containing protein n=1 Tax=Odynerus spinipes TaxID=1348599 RepID=A0AAD9VSF2_9HYME|nr:hypothetical protein KPH14_006758 [Odynerus spinipes]